MRIRSTTIQGLKVSALIERKSFEAAEFAIQWTGGRQFTPGEDTNFLTKAVRGKLSKHYARPADAFWLLAYSTNVLLTMSQGEADILAARALLSRASHPFDEVWYIYPHPNRELGHLIKIWPE
jgi:hypothetical protein